MAKVAKNGELTKKEFFSKAKALKVCVAVAVAAADEYIVMTEEPKEFQRGTVGWPIPWSDVTVLVGGRELACTIQGTIVVKGSAQMK